MPVADTPRTIPDDFAASVVQEAVRQFFEAYKATQRPIFLAGIRDSARILTCVGVRPGSREHLQDMVTDPAKSGDFGTALRALQHWQFETPRPIPLPPPDYPIASLQWAPDPSSRHWTTYASPTPPTTP